MQSEADTPVEQPPEAQPDRYAIIEIFGHRRHAGRVIEVEQFGSKMLRVDVPTDGDFEKGYTSHFYGGAAIFGMVETDLATVIKANKPYQPALPYRSRDEDEDEADDERPF